MPQFDTGAWSLYQPGVEDTLSYHELVTGFLQQLCTRTKVPVYCVTAQHFTAYLTTPPALQLLTQHVRKGKSSSISFHLSKISRVGIVVIGPGGNTLFSTSATFGYGNALVHGAAAQAQGHLHDPPRRDRPRGQLQPDRGDDPGVVIGLSIISVTGPSLTSSTAIIAPNTPRSAPRRSQNRSYSGSASSGAAAAT